MRKLEETNFNENSWMRIKYYVVKVVIILKVNISGLTELCLPRLSTITYGWRKLMFPPPHCMSLRASKKGGWTVAVLLSVNCDLGGNQCALWIITFSSSEKRQVLHPEVVLRTHLPTLLSWKRSQEPQGPAKPSWKFTCVQF